MKQGKSSLSESRRPKKPRETSFKEVKRQLAHLVWVSDSGSLCPPINVSQMPGSLQAQQSYQRPLPSTPNQEGRKEKKKRMKKRTENKDSPPTKTTSKLCFFCGLSDVQQTFSSLLTFDTEKCWIFFSTCVAHHSLHVPGCSPTYSQGCHISENHLELTS